METNMNKIKHKLNDTQKEFVYNLSQYINTPLIFYGSILRNDYIPNKSDIDVAIFTDNENSTIYKLTDFLNIKKSDFKKVVYKIKTKVVHGYKYMYINGNQDIKLEISVYNNKYKKIITNEHSICEQLPYYIGWMLIIIKCLYYHLGFISFDMYRKCKNLLMNSLKDSQFMLLDFSKLYM